MDFLTQEMGSYIQSTLGKNKGDILVSPISILENGNLPNFVYNAFIESATILNDEFCDGRYLAIDDERPLQCYMYAFLMYEGAYSINIENNAKKLYTLSENTLKEGIYNCIWASDNDKTDIDLKVQKMIANIRGNNKVTNTVMSGGSEVYAYRLDKAYHIREDMSMHYTPVAPRTCIDLNKEVLIPYSVYRALTKSMITSLKDNIIVFKCNNRVTVATYNKKVLATVFDEERAHELLTKCSVYNNREDLTEFYVPNLIASVYSDGTSRYTLEGITNSQVMSVSDLKRLLNGETLFAYNQNIDFSLKDVDVRGAKNYLKDKLDYENLSDDKKAMVDSYSDTEAYRYLQSKGNKSINTYGTKLKLPRQGKPVDVPTDEKEMRQLMSSGVYEVEFYSRRGLSKLICTGNNAVVEKVYGEDYRIYCNSENSRIREFYNNLSYYARTNMEQAQKFAYSDMERKYGITFSMLNMSTPERFEEVEVQRMLTIFENALQNVKSSTQNSMQILVTCLTDRKPKEGAGRNLTRSLYLETVKSIKLLASVESVLQ